MGGRRRSPGSRNKDIRQCLHVSARGDDQVPRFVIGELSDPPTTWKASGVLYLDAMTDEPLTYADAGVDIEAGDKAVELLKESVRRATRP